MRARIWAMVGATGLALALMAGVRGQEANAALRDRVAQLVEKLDAPKAQARDDAEKALIKLGPRVLPLLPEATKGAKSSERNQRLERVRTALAEEQEKTSLSASRITLKREGITLSAALGQLQKQSHNVINDLREQNGVEATNPKLDLDIEGMPFFEALDLIARKADVSYTMFAGDGSIGLMGPADPASARPMLLYPGPFRVLFKQVGLLKDFKTGDATAKLQFEVGWEPRLRPMLLRLKADELKVQDDRGQEVAAKVMAESDEVVLRPENPASVVNLDLNAPDRAARKLSLVRVKADVTVPAGIRTFRFPSLAKEDQKQTQGDITVTLESTRSEESTWTVSVTVDYGDGGPAFESYQQGLFNNQVFLQKPDGSTFEQNGGFNTTGAENGRLGFEYHFVDVPGKPGDWGLVYKTPSKVLTIPLEFEFKDVPLP